MIINNFSKILNTTVGNYLKLDEKEHMIIL